VQDHHPAHHRGGPQQLLLPQLPEGSAITKENPHNEIGKEANCLESLSRT